MEPKSELEEIELFDAYMDNSLSMQDQMDFEKRMASDVSFKRRYQLHVMLVEEIRKRLFREQLKEYELQQKTFRVHLISYVAAACVCMVMGGGAYYQNYTVLDSQSMEQVNFSHFSYEGALFDGKTVEDALVSGNTKSLQNIVDKLQKQNQLVPRDGLQDDLDWTQVMIYAKEHKVIKARKLLRKIKKSDSKYRYEAQKLMESLWF